MRLLQSLVYRWVRGSHGAVPRLPTGRVRYRRAHVLQREKRMGVGLQRQHGGRQRADPGVLLLARLPDQLQPHPAGSGLNHWLQTFADIYHRSVVLVAVLVFLLRHGSCHVTTNCPNCRQEYESSYWDDIRIFVGCMADGTTLGDVELPPWAKGDPQEFIRIQREVSEP